MSQIGNPCHEMLREASFSLKREAAADVDRVTWRQYGEALEDNLQDLSERLKRGGTGRSRFGAEPLPVPGWLVGWLWYRSLWRRSQKARLTCERMRRLIDRWLPPARICHPYPLRRLGVIT